MDDGAVAHAEASGYATWAHVAGVSAYALRPRQGSDAKADFRRSAPAAASRQVRHASDQYTWITVTNQIQVSEPSRRCERETFANDSGPGDIIRATDDALDGRRLGCNREHVR
jgi:hypothetical protein